MPKHDLGSPWYWLSGIEQFLERPNELVMRRRLPIQWFHIASVGIEKLNDVVNSGSTCTMHLNSELT